MANLQQFKSPDSRNVYTVIAGRGKGKTLEQVGLSLDSHQGALVIRFCVFAEEGPPKLKNMELRMAPKQYVQYPITTPKALRNGCAMDKVLVPVVQHPRAERHDVLVALNEDDGWDKLSEWIGATMASEGFQMLAPTQEEFVGLLPQILVGVGVDKMKVKIEYPAPLVKPVKVKVHPNHPGDDSPEDPDDDGDFHPEQGEP